MPSSTLMRAFLDAVWPDGSIWRPAPGEDLDHFLDGLTDIWQQVHDNMGSLALLRDPRRTPYLEELERDYGVMPNSQLTDAQRRENLAMAKYGRGKTSTADTLQDALDRAGLGTGGYGLHVYANDPAVDPAPFMLGTFQTYLGGGNNQYLGYNTGGITRSFMGVAAGGGLWIVNGDVYQASPNYESLGGSQSYLGYVRSGSPGGFNLGEFYSVSFLPVQWPSPTDPTTWPAVFFLAASATRDGSGHITALTFATIPGNLRQTLVEIVMRWKPMHCWAALMAYFS